MTALKIDTQQRFCDTCGARLEPEHTGWWCEQCDEELVFVWEDDPTDYIWCEWNQAAGSTDERFIIGDGK